MKIGIYLKKIRTIFSKSLLRFIVITAAVLIILLIFISPIAKYLIEKYDTKFTGREITMNWAYVNPFTGYIYLDQPKIYELNSDSLALTAKSLSVNVEMLKLFSKTYNIGKLTLDEPKIIIAQNGSQRNLNFKDLIEKFSPKDRDTTKIPTRFIIESLIINHGAVYYRENVTPISYFVKDVNISSSPLGWGADTISFKYSFLSGINSGNMRGRFMINVTNLKYTLNADIEKYDLQILEQYLKGISNYGRFRANFDAKIRSKGSLVNARDLEMNGGVAINEMHFGKDSIEDYASFKKLSIGIKALYPGNHIYVFDTIALLQPYFKYERYDHLDNFQTVFGKGGSKVGANSGRFNLILEIASYVEKLSKNFFRSYYKVNRIEISKANFEYEDYALNEKFSASTDSLYLEADSIDKSRENIKAHLYTNLKPYGRVSLNLSVDPRDSANFDLQYKLDKFPLAMFNPYLVTYTSFPLDRGVLEVKGSWRVRDGNIQSNNHLIIIDPRLADRVKNKGAKWLPMHFIMALVRERGNVIDYEIPITGNLKKPKLHFKDAITDLLTNLWLNPATMPYRIDVKQTEKEIEKSLSLTWKMGQSELDKGQKKFLDKIARYLEENPEERISVYPAQYSEREKEHILFYESKKKYYLSAKHIKKGDYDEDDSIRVNKISIRDSFFTIYLNKCCNHYLVFTIQEKCELLIGKDIVNKKFKLLERQRKNEFMACFKENNTEKQVKINATKHTIPFNGFSFYKIKYKGEIPNYLERSYRKMDDYDSRAPRKKFKKKRNKINGKHSNSK